MSRKIIIIESDDEDINVLTIEDRKKPVDGSWFCPYCGKRVYSMEVHNCNQPYC